MCGHVGVAGDLSLLGVKAFRDMLFFDTVRGEDGTGIAAVPWIKDNRTAEDTIVHKMPVTASVFLDNKYTDTLLSSASSRLSVLIGHNRAATRGVHTQENTHPFLHENVVGAHNGTVSDYNMDKKIKAKGEFDTDSETILYNFSETSVEDTIPLLTSTHSQGAWAFVWYDFRENSLNFIRNSQRPFYFAFSEDRNMIFWASEIGILAAGCLRRGIDLEPVSKKDKRPNIRQLAVDTLYSWFVPGSGEKFGEGGRTPLEGAEEKRYTSGGYSNTYPYGSRQPPFRRKADNVTPLFRPNRFDASLQGFSLSEAEVLTAFRSGATKCANCGVDVGELDYTKGKAVAITKQSIVCEACIDDKEFDDMYKEPRKKEK